MLAREIAPLLPGADGGLAVRGGLEGRGPGRGLSLGRLLPRPGSKRLRGKPRPRGRIRGKRPSGERRRPGVECFGLSLDFKNPPLCACVERCQAPRPLSFTLTAFNWCWEPGVPGRCYRSASVRPVVVRPVLVRRGARADLRPPRRPAPPAEPRAPGRVGREDSIVPGNLSFRTYTCACLVRGATTQRVFSRPVLGLGFRELPSPPSHGGCLFKLTLWDRVPPSLTPSN